MKKYLFFFAALFSVMLMSCSEAKLEAAVAQANKDCPENLGSGMVMESIKLEGMNVVYTIKCDESMIDLDVLEQNLSVAKQAIIQEIQGATGSDADDIQEMITLLKDSDKGLLYRYVGSTSGKEVKVRVSNAELK